MAFRTSASAAMPISRGPNFALMSPSTDIQVADTFSWVHNPHVVKAGFMYIRDRVDQNGRPSYTGSVSFDPSGGTNSTGNAFADALLGNFRNYTEASGDPIGFFRFTQMEAFVQDSWKVTKKLSLDLGIRYQYLPPMYTQANNMANFVPSLYDPAQAVSLNTKGFIIPGSGDPYNGLIRAGDGVPSSELGRVPNGNSPDVLSVPAGAPRGFYDSHSQFAPRFGFAYAADDKTVIRGGYGLFYYRPEGNIIFSGVNVPPFLQISQFENGNLANPGGAAGVAAVVGSINAIDPKLKTSYTEQFSFGVQRQLPLGLFLETSYVGNLGRDLLRNPDINQPSFELQSANAKLPKSQQAATNYLRPYKGFSTIRYLISDSTSNYHCASGVSVETLRFCDIHRRLYLVKGFGRFKRVRRQSGELSGPPLQLWTSQLRSSSCLFRDIRLGTAKADPTECDCERRRRRLAI